MIGDSFDVSTLPYLIKIVFILKKSHKASLELLQRQGLRWLLLEEAGNRFLVASGEVDLLGPEI